MPTNNGWIGLRTGQKDISLTQYEKASRQEFQAKEGRGKGNQQIKG